MPVVYHVIDNTTKMTARDWNRVVAVFVLGQSWQFKDWQWSSPVELFSNVRGYYLKYDDAQVPPEVKSWNVKILTISKNKRHLDQTAALEFWNTLDEFMARKGNH
jgi:parafibromin